MQVIGQIVDERPSQLEFWMEVNAAGRGKIMVDAGSDTIKSPARKLLTRPKKGASNAELVHSILNAKMGVATVSDNEQLWTHYLQQT